VIIERFLRHNALEIEFLRVGNFRMGSQLRNGTLFVCLEILLGTWLVNQAIAQPPSQPLTSPSKKEVTLFQNLTISPKFLPDPQVLRGISGGTEETQKQSGKVNTETGMCIGFVDTSPDHQVTLSAAFDFLQLKVSSTGDTVLLIKGPGGVWCNDDGTDRNPDISGAWLPGTYEVWIGSYEAKASFPYLLEISQQQPK
jgi:hypothetical protein